MISGIPTRFSFDSKHPPHLDIETAQTPELPTDGKLLSYAGFYYKKKVNAVGSKHTQRSKKGSLQKFVNFFYHRHPAGDIKLWDLATTQAFMNALEKHPFKTATLNLHMDNLTSFSTFLERKHLWSYEDNPVRGITRPTTTELEPQGIYLLNENNVPSKVKISTEELFNEMVTAAERLIVERKDSPVSKKAHPPCPYRDLAVLVTLYYGALRVDEMCGLLVEQMQYDEETGGAFFPKLKGKGNKERTVFITKCAYEAIMQYMNSKERENGTRSPYIFVTWSGKRLTQPYAWHGLDEIRKTTEAVLNVKLRSLIEAAGEKNVRIHIHPHSLRHQRTYALLHSEKKIPESTIAKDILGHTTTKYIGRYGKRPIREVADKIKDIP